MAWIDQVEDHHDVADIAFGGGRDIGVAAVEVVAVHALARRHPLGNLLRVTRLADVVDGEPASEILRAARAELLVVDDHHAVLNPHLVRVPSRRDFDRHDFPGLSRVGHVEQRGAARRPHVPHIHSGAIDPHLAAARAIRMAQKLRVVRLRQGCQAKRSRSPAALRPQRL